MPSIKDFNKKNKEAEQQEFDLTSTKEEKDHKKKTKKRRPHLENAEKQELASDSPSDSQTHSETSEQLESSVQQNVDENAESTVEVKESQTSEGHEEPQSEQEKVIKITDLPGYWGLGAGMVKAAAPKVVDVIENVATEWVNDGNFYNVPVGHPIAQYAVGEALRNVKKVEKKLEEKGVFMMAQIGVDYLKSKIKK